MSSSDPVITVDRLNKRYRLGVARHDTLRDRLTHALRSFGRAPRDASRADEFWALRDVSFAVNRGEVLGVIGRNGAGKSTLLKILSRITDPTRGRIALRGRVASLLEVGTGFHPELTGRENVFLNGAILGMTRTEIRRKFDEIVAFAEVERFLDTPVKHYSSGMYVRLAFAVAAHLEPEILIVDEVLAVGDAAFQKKCLGKMRDVTRGGDRTVLFVSHQMAVIRQLCNRAILLGQGRLIAHAPVNEVAARYEASFAEAQQLGYNRPATAPCNKCWFESIKLNGEQTPGLSLFCPGRPIMLDLVLACARELPALQVAIRVSTVGGLAVLTTTSADHARSYNRLEPGRYHFRVELPPILAPGGYKLTVAALEPQREVFDVVDEIIGFEIDRVGSLAGELRDDRAGLVETLAPWQQERLGDA